MNDSLPFPDTTRRAVEYTLSARFGRRAQIVDAESFWPSSVFRCTLLWLASGDETWEGRNLLPETVIVRIPREGATRSGRNGLYAETEALAYLSTIGSSLAPRLIASGGAEGFLVNEDLGGDPSLLDLLLGKEPTAAREGAFAFAHGLGTLHAQTILRNMEAPALPVVHVAVMEHWEQVKEAVVRLGLPIPHGVDNDVEAIVRVLSEPDACLALSSGDASVVNCKVTRNGVRFFDFEEACFRSPFVDAAILRFPYPTGGPPWRLPRDLAQESEAAYRTALTTTCAIAEDDALYERGMAAAVTAWTIVRQARLPKIDAGPDRDPWLLLPPGWNAPIPVRSRRRQLVAILEMCIDAANRASAFQAFAAWCECLVDALRERWPEAGEELPLYPAFINVS